MFQLGAHRHAYSQPTNLIQQPHQIAMYKDRQHTHRLIPMDGRPHLDKKISTWTGDSRGRWVGRHARHRDHQLQRQDVAGSRGHVPDGGFEDDRTDAFIDEDTLLVEETLIDPKIFTQPWKLALGVDAQRATPSPKTTSSGTTTYGSTARSIFHPAAPGDGAVSRLQGGH
jgi:hypothetical protein